MTIEDLLFESIRCDDHETVIQVLADRSELLSAIEDEQAVGLSECSSLVQAAVDRLTYHNSDGDWTTLKYLVENGVDLNKRNAYGETPLMWVARDGNLELFKYLVEHGASLDVSDKTGANSMEWAIQDGIQQNIVDYINELKK